MRPQFKYTDLKSKIFSETNAHSFSGTEPWVTPEKNSCKGYYNEDDLNGMEHLGYAAGIPPFLRGPYSGMSLTMAPASAMRRARAALRAG